jgi:hypothetical protein
VAALAASPHLAGLVALRLSQCAVGGAGIADLAQSKHLGQLQYLDLSNSLTTADGLAQLGEGEGLPALVALELGYSGISHNDLAALVRRPLAGRLQRLRLDNNPLGDAGALELAISNLGMLRELTLAGTNIGDAGAITLADSSRLERLERLDLAGCPIGEEGAVALASSRHLDRLSRLDLTCSLPPGALARLLGSARLPALTWLGLGGGLLDHADAAALAQSPLVRRLAVLHLRFNTVGEAAVAPLLSIPAQAGPQELHISASSWETQMCERLKEHFGGRVRLS